MKSAFKLLFGLSVLLAIPLLAAEDEDAKTAHPLDGSWRWNFAMPDGTTVRPKLTLAVKDGKLTGTTSFRAGTEAHITNAVLNGDQLRFDVIRDRDGQQIITTYSGKWDTNSIKGKVESNWAGEKQTFDWTAQRAHIGIEGTWRWNRSFGRGGGGGGGGGRGGRGFQERVELEQHGELITGSMPGFSFGGRQAPKLEIQNGVFTNGVVYFEVERQRFGSDEKTTTYYEGKVHGDTIKGFIESTDFEGNPVENDWEAKRTD